MIDFLIVAAAFFAGQLNYEFKIDLRTKKERKIPKKMILAAFSVFLVAF
jgi:hypothetical protein